MGFYKTIDGYRKKASPYATTSYITVFVILSLLLINAMHWAIQTAYGVTAKKKKKASTKLMNQTFQSTLSLMMVRMNPFWSREVTYETPDKEMPPTVIYMSNHTALVDAFFSIGSFRHYTVGVAQSHVLNYPLMGPVAKNAGMLPVYFKRVDGRWRTDRSETEKMLKLAEKTLENGISVCVYPEGTIPIDGNLLPFKKGFFRLAVKTNIPVLPLSTWGAQRALPMAPRDAKGISRPQRYAKPSTVYLHGAAPIEAIGMDVLQEDGLSDLIGAIISDESNGIEEEDFTVEGKDVLGKKLLEAGEAGNDNCAELFNIIVDRLVEKVKDVIQVNLTELKERERLEDEKADEYVQKVDDFIGDSVKALIG